ncbi:DsbA family protein [Haloplanus ruber]|uniref:DsbA family protein n=1 Tax=Haloplanus ruber TaxID=869892 RepID=A0ABD6CY47_9EURY|nr:thioredoxin domain-containing protein [Haloplanus ruber]
MNDGSGPGRLTRRGTLTAGLSFLGAGCLGGGGDEDGTRSLSTHPVGTDLNVQPRLGPEPGLAPATIVAFEDPSCPRCAAFEQNTVPQIRTELVDPGEATFVSRTIPVVYPWGSPATYALEATFARDADAFWTLAAHYFDRQDTFDRDNVLDRTESFLAAETDVDAAGVVDDAEREVHADAVQTDLDASEAADVDGTPTVFLFRDGEYRTRATGSVSFDFVTGALEP